MEGGIATDLVLRIRELFPLSNADALVCGQDARFSVITVIFGALCVLFFIITICLVKRAYRTYLFNEFRAEYRIDLSRAGRQRGVLSISKRKPAQSNTYNLGKVFWRHSNKDGSADGRRKDNDLIYRKSHLAVGRFSVVCSEPILMVWLVRELRKRGIEIARIEAERVKFQEVVRHRNRVRNNQSLQAILRSFSMRPSEFEEYCADLFRSEGYQAEVTPPTNDGGYDIQLIDDAGCSVLVECKLYGLEHKVDRPLIQKLVGANAVECADRMMFVTTSSFTPGAQDYARKTAVELIDGERLMRMVRRNANSNQNTLVVENDEWQLEWEDVARLCYPPDRAPQRIALP